MKVTVFFVIVLHILFEKITAQCAADMERSRDCLKQLGTSDIRAAHDRIKTAIDNAVLACFDKNENCQKEIAAKQERIAHKIQSHIAARECMENVIEGAIGNDAVQDKPMIRGFHAAMQAEVDECLQNQQNSASFSPFSRFPGTVGHNPQLSRGPQRLTGQPRQQFNCSPTREQRQCVANAVTQLPLENRSQNQRIPFVSQQASQQRFQQFQQGQSFPNGFQTLRECRDMVPQECRPQNPETFDCLCEAQRKFQNEVHQSAAFQQCIQDKGITEMEFPEIMCERIRPPFQPNQFQNPGQAVGYQNFQQG